MPAKRKAPSSVQGGTKAGKASKASTPGPSTPKNLDESDDDYMSEEEDERSDHEKETIRKTIDQFSLETYKKKADTTHKGRDSASHHFGNKDFSYLDLKIDHDNRPIWIDPFKGRITLESFSPYASQVQDFLTTIAEPLSRPTFLHEYKITAHSLYAAVATGIHAPEILATLQKFSKVPVPEALRSYIITCAKSFGKIKLVLKNARYFVESDDPENLQMLLRDNIIGPLRVQSEDALITTAAPKMGALVIPGTNNAAGMAAQHAPESNAKNNKPEDPTQEEMEMELNVDDDEVTAIETVHAFEIADKDVETVQKRCLELGYPILEEYDFGMDLPNTTLDIDLRPGSTIRGYQEKCLSKMFANGRAKSGIIVLPCGAGKTLVGITAACTIKKSVIVLCTSSMSAVQWRQEFLKWSNINPDDIAIFTSDHKIKFKGDAGIIVSTYPMMSAGGKRSHDTRKVMDWLTNKEWGLMILDEVHVVPAHMFRKVTSVIKTHAKLGLTATLLREDDKIEDLNFLIGPKLYEANWMELAEAGHIARVQCAEVWCPMTTEFYTEYLNVSARRKALLYNMNPRKFQACQFLIDYHERRGDKIIVFSDNIYALKQYALRLGKAYIHGETGQNERLQILANFQHNPSVNTLFLSKIGDTSLDLPEATCLIQISSHYGSRRQEAQRLGRILRAKRRNDEGFNAFFYTLVSKDTEEMYYASKRQAFLVDQGYAFKVITHLEGLENLPGLAFSTPFERCELLQEVTLYNEDNEEDRKAGRTDDLAYHKTKSKAKRRAAMLGDYGGGQDMAYVEQNRSKNKELMKKNQQARKGGAKFIQGLRKDVKRLAELRG